jgi:hypothetical protein
MQPILFGFGTWLKSGVRMVVRIFPIRGSTICLLFFGALREMEFENHPLVPAYPSTTNSAQLSCSISSQLRTVDLLYILYCRFEFRLIRFVFRVTLFASRFILVSLFAYYSTLKMEEPCSADTSTEYERTTRRHIQEYGTLYYHRCENLSPSPESTLSQMNPVHTLTPYFLKVHFNRIHLSTPR